MNLGELKTLIGPSAYRDLICGIRCEAQHDANQLADLLKRISQPANNEAPSKKTGVNENALSLALLVAAVLRVQRWRDNAHDQYLSYKPEWGVVNQIAKHVSNSTFDDEAANNARKFGVDAFTTWIKNFSWSARRTLGIDVVFSNPPALLARLDDLADYLQSQCHLMTAEKGGNDADS